MRLIALAAVLLFWAAPAPAVTVNCTDGSVWEGESIDDFPGCPKFTNQAAGGSTSGLGEGALWGGLLFLFLMLVVIALYFLPALIALNRGHPNKLPIGVLNLLLGWSLIGWVAALVWALVAIAEEQGTEPPPAEQVSGTPTPPKDTARAGDRCREPTKPRLKWDPKDR